MALDQGTRFLRLTTPLGDNKLLLTSFRGQEAMSGLFEFDLEMISDDNAIQATDIVGKNVTFSVQLADDSPRFYNGFVSRFAAGDEDDEGRRNYYATVVPWLWFLTRTSDCRIFQQKTVPQIIEQIFNDLGFSDFKLQLSGSHPEREYCVQYRESDFNFVTRLAEDEGICYFFEHEDGKHTLVLADHMGACVDCSENEVEFPRDYGTRAVEDHITAWKHRYEFRTGKWAQTDYNFTTPSTDLMTNSSTVVPLSDATKYESYDYPGIYGNSGDGRALTDLRMEEEEAGYDVVEGSSLCKSFVTGGKFKIKRHRSDNEEGNTYILTSVAHEAVEPLAYESGATVEHDYRNSFTCIPDSVVFRPTRTTPKPFVRGVQTAVVVGPAGEEIYPDEYGRVKVQFHWDREGKKDENSSCWIRVAQIHAGPGFGGIDIPRMGEEVIVDFLEGDPDRPIVTGRVYHAENMPPFGLPDSKTISGLKSKTYKGDGYNEYIMDDTPGNELIREHGQFDKDSTIENDLREHVLNDRSRDVTNNETIQVGVDRTKTVGNNESLTVGANRTRNVGANESVTVALTRTHTVGVNEAITVGAAQEITVGATRAVTVGSSQTINVGGDQSMSIGGSLSESVGKDRSETIGKNLSIEAGDQIQIKTGKASITMKKDGTITIQGKDITVKGSGKINQEAKKDMILKGKKILQN